MDTKDWLNDPDLIDKSRIFNEAVSIHRYLNNRDQRRSNSAHKGVRTRRKNESITTQVKKAIAEEKASEMAFLPLKFKDPRAKISVLDYLTLLEQFPDKRELIDQLYQARLNSDSP